MMNKSTIESRIAAMLSAADAKSDAIVALITEVEVAAQEADATATKTREEALDPATVVDTAMIGAAVATAALTRDRLQAALPRLRARYTEVREQEDIAAWKTDAEKLEVRRIAKMTEFADFYPPMCERMVDHLYSMCALDREIDDLNRRRPNGSVRALEYSTPAFTVDLKIPDPYNDDQPLWPPLQLTASQQLARAMLANPDAYTDRFVVSEAAAGTYIGARNRRVLEDNRRQITEAEQRQREREQREAAEMAKIKQADHMGRVTG
jgi:hypothetical protein